MTTIPCFLGDVSDVHINQMNQVGRLIQYHSPKTTLLTFFWGGVCVQAKALVGMKGDAGPQKLGKSTALGPLMKASKRRGMLAIIGP